MCQISCVFFKKYNMYMRSLSHVLYFVVFLYTMWTRGFETKLINHLSRWIPSSRWGSRRCGTEAGWCRRCPPLWRHTPPGRRRRPTVSHGWPRPLWANLSDTQRWVSEERRNKSPWSPAPVYRCDPATEFSWFCSFCHTPMVQISKWTVI